jgi:hypothetical protein
MARVREVMAGNPSGTNEMPIYYVNNIIRVK